MKYDMISDALIISEKRPRRAFFSFFVHQYSLILGAAITLIIAVSAFPYAPRWAVAWIILYWIYHIAKTVSRKHHFWGMPYHSKWVQFGRSILVVVCVTVFLGYLYLHTDYLENEGTDTLWLFFYWLPLLQANSGLPN